MSPFEKIEMCRALVSTVGVDAAASALAESANGYLSDVQARELVTQVLEPSELHLRVARRAT